MKKKSNTPQKKMQQSPSRTQVKQASPQRQSIKQSSPRSMVQKSSASPKLSNAKVQLSPSRQNQFQASLSNSSGVKAQQHGLIPKTKNSNIQNSDPFKKIPFKYNLNKPFNDDYEIVKQEVKEEEKKDQEYDIQNNLFLEVRARVNKIKLGKEAFDLPVMVTIRTQDQQEDDAVAQQMEQELPKEHAKIEPKQNSRNIGIDLICVIDHSGSMCGQKISLVRQTLEYVLEQLIDIDRLCLIQFDDNCDRLTPLVSCTEDNKQKITQVIKKLHDCGGTDINLGMQCAFEQLKQRQYKNNVTSIFLLSDGLDGGAENRVSEALFKKYQALNDQIFTIHSFGFGQDHDPKLMSSICQLRDGNFYFIQDLSKLDECFISALGALFSVVAQNIIISIEIQGSQVQYQCAKTFGDMWNKINDKNLEIKITQLISGISKDFLMLLNIPEQDCAASKEQIKKVLLMKVKITGYKKDGSQFQKEKELFIDFFLENEDIGEIDEDGEVMENFCRVEAASAIEEALAHGEKGKYDEGQTQLDIAISKIEKCKANKKVNQSKLENFQKDLVRVKEQCNNQVFNQFGKHNMIMFKKSHMEQKAKGIEMEGESEEADMYSNFKQKSMKRALKSKKMG